MSDAEDDCPKKGSKRIEIAFIQDKNRRQITFSKRKGGIMKKAAELSTLTGSSVLLMVASESGCIFSTATRGFKNVLPQAKQAFAEVMLGGAKEEGDGADLTDEADPLMDTDDRLIRQARAKRSRETPVLSTPPPHSRTTTPAALPPVGGAGATIGTGALAMPMPTPASVVPAFHASIDGLKTPPASGGRLGENRTPGFTQGVTGLRTAGGTLSKSSPGMGVNLPLPTPSTRPAPPSAVSAQGLISPPAVPIKRLGGEGMSPSAANNLESSFQSIAGAHSPAMIDTSFANTNTDMVEGPTSIPTPTSVSASQSASSMMTHPSPELKQLQASTRVFHYLWSRALSPNGNGPSSGPLSAVSPPPFGASTSLQFPGAPVVNSTAGANATSPPVIPQASPLGNGSGCSPRTGGD